MVLCPTCGARKEAGSWSDLGMERSELAHQMVTRAVRFHPDFRLIAMDITLDEMSANRSRAHCRVSGTLFGEPVEGSCTLEVDWQKEQCDRCCRISGSYYEGVVQVRATGRRPSSREMEEATRIAYAVEESMMASGERLSFISQLDEHRDGLDITVGSQRLGSEIASAITRDLGGRYTTHPKLVGEKAGRQIFRITYSLRLPRYSRGDIILYSGRYAEVLGVDGKLLRCLDLATGSVRSVPEQQVERRAGHKGDAVDWMVAFRDGDLLGILDPGTGVTREIRAPPGREIPSGATVRILEDGERLVLVG
jgi:nonsense-mediated mRNA decay protein 3